MLIDNIRIEAKNIHIRLEDNGISIPNKYFSIGAHLKYFKAASTDSEYKETFIKDPKNSGYNKFKIEGLSLYMEINKSNYW